MLQRTNASAIMPTTCHLWLNLRPGGGVGSGSSSLDCVVVMMGTAAGVVVGVVVGVVSC